MKLLIIATIGITLGHSSLPLLAQKSNNSAKIEEEHRGKATSTSLDYHMQKEQNDASAYQRFEQRVHVVGKPEDIERAIEDIKDNQVKDELKKQHQNAKSP